LNIRNGKYLGARTKPFRFYDVLVYHLIVIWRYSSAGGDRPRGDIFYLAELFHIQNLHVPMSSAFLIENFDAVRMSLGGRRVVRVHGTIKDERRPAHARSFHIGGC
jgi:hypothetical protein